MSGKSYLRNQNFFKRNYFEALKYIIPRYLYDDDAEETPKQEDLVDTIINSHIDIADNISTIIDVSAVSDSVYSGINTLEGICPFFIKQNNLTNITTQNFEDKILSYLNVNFKDYENKTEFTTYVEQTLLPAITLNEPDASVFSDIGDSSAIHNYLITNLSWMYFLNTSGSSYDPSSYVKDLIVNNLYTGKRVTLKDGINGLTEFVWKNQLGDYYPSAIFASGSRSDLSGTQQLDKLKTWNEVIYSPLFSDSSDFKVRDKFSTYIDSGLKSSNKIEDGPFARFMRALSFLAFDSSDETEGISTLYDIEDCPDDYLPLLAQLIGWDLFGNDPQRWRLQLRSAVNIYKTVGTKSSVQRTINTIFPKDILPIEGRLTEMWESYVPYLIYYALATESSLFKSFETWTAAEANSRNIETYATDMDENIRLAVDRIIYEIVDQFPERFPIDIWRSQHNLTFNYRGRDYQIPPFEEYPYYVNIELDQDMVSFIADRLACFGVRNEFALDVSSYITTNALTKDDEPRLNSWLIFTSGYNSPPNIDSVISKVDNQKIDYVPLWSGKSSHFKLVLQSSEFDFTKNNLDQVTTGDAMIFASRAVAKSSPAHAIPVITLEVSGDPDYFGYESSALPGVYIDREEIDQGAGNNLFSSGIYFNSYKRDVNTNGVALGREATQSLVSPTMLSLSSLGGVSRVTARRRSYEKVMPFNGYYDRTGFNMPISFDMASGTSGIPLGLIPSSLTYTPVSSHVDLPAIWSQCEGLASNNTYYEYDVSNTLNARGSAGTFQSNTDRTVDRCQVPGIYTTMHRISENRKYLQAFLDFSSSTESLETYLLNLSSALNDPLTSTTEQPYLLSEILRVQALLDGDYRSYVASSTNNNDSDYSFPNSINDYYYFKFGRDLHRLYHIYHENFQWHRLGYNIQNQDGANIFSHTYGPLLYNHNFENIGTQDLITSSFATAAKTIDVTSAPFTGVDSFAASTNDSMYLNGFERVCSGLVDGVELVLPSSTQNYGSFSVIRVPGTERASYEDPFLYDKTLILMRSLAGATTRIRFDISKYSIDSLSPISNNFLSPEHEFKVSFNSLFSNFNATTVGGRNVGVWIHTKPEDGKMWSYTSKGQWVQHDQLISRDDMLNLYSHKKLLEQRPNDPQTTNTTRNYACLPSTTTTRLSPVVGFGASSFEDFTVSFDTRNRDITLPMSYQKTYGKLHRLDQNYVVEVFMYPDAQPTEFLVVDRVVMQDVTLKKLSEIYATGTLSDPLCKLDNLKRGCLEYRLELSKQDLFDIFKHFNNIAGKNAANGYASRDKNRTETIMESEGGSRIDYRLPQQLWFATGLSTFGNYYSEVIIQV